MCLKVKHNSTLAKVQIFFWTDKTRTWDGLATDLGQIFAKNFYKMGVKGGETR